MRNEWNKLTDLAPRPLLTSCRQTLVEITLIFAVFAIQGAWPVPDVNEPHYLGKAIHYWNPDWLRGDFFMESTDTHKVFDFAFGWLSLWLSPVALAWTGRILTWLLLAWAWRRLSVAVVSRPWYSILTAALFGCMMERCHMAGEWVIGGIEAKGFAYVFVFLGLESLVRNRWNRALLLFGAASAFHVLVGGWAAIAAGVAWLSLNLPSPFGRGAGGEGTGLPSPFGRGVGGEGIAPPLRSLWFGILGGLLLSLPGLLPSLTLDWGADLQTTQQSHQLYVFERLPHHLTLTGIRPEFIVRLILLWVVWLLLGWWNKRSSLPTDRSDCLPRLRAFVTGTVAITFVGVAIHLLILVDRAMAANLLRYYWFRLTDVALPLGVALEGVALIVGVRGSCSSDEKNNSRGLFGKRLEVRQLSLSEKNVSRSPVQRRRAHGMRPCWLAFALLVAAFHVGDRAIDRIAPRPPRSHRIADFDAWHKACLWVANSGQIPPDARFLTPRLAQTFKWYTNRSDVATWKDVPQNAEKIVEWWDRIQDIFASGKQPPDSRWYGSLAEMGENRLRQLGAKYAANYAITEVTDPPLQLDVVYQNRAYIIYRLR